MTPELNENANLIIQLRLIARGDDEPVSDNDVRVRLYDKDIFNDDFLGESAVVDGMAKLVITQKDFKGPLGIDERPDFYFVVYQSGREIFRSKVMSNLDLSDIEEFVMKEGEVIDLGTFLVDTNH